MWQVVTTGYVYEKIQLAAKCQRQTELQIRNRVTDLHVVLQPRLWHVLHLFLQTVELSADHAALDVRLVLNDGEIHREGFLINWIEALGQRVKVVRVEPPLPGREVLEDF